MNLFRIRPVEKKSIEYFVDLYEVLPDGTKRGFDVTHYYRWGQGFRTEDNPVYADELRTVYCNPETGLGSELDDLCGADVNFDDGKFSQEEQDHIRALLSYETEDDDGLSGLAWIYDGDHNFQVDDDHIAIIGPVQIDLVNAHGEVISENISPEE